jgi:hypothetical protein
MLVSRREGRLALVAAQRGVSIKNEWPRRYSARLTMSSRRIELRETRDVIKETDERPHVGAGCVERHREEAQRAS